MEGSPMNTEIVKINNIFRLIKILFEGHLTTTNYYLSNEYCKAMLETVLSKLKSDREIGVLQGTLTKEAEKWNRHEFIPNCIETYFREKNLSWNYLVDLFLCYFILIQLVNENKLSRTVSESFFDDNFSLTSTGDILSWVITNRGFDGFLDAVKKDKLYPNKNDTPDSSFFSKKIILIGSLPILALIIGIGFYNKEKIKINLPTILSMFKKS
jgi:hypothetical protein